MNTVTRLLCLLLLLFAVTSLIGSSVATSAEFATNRQQPDDANALTVQSLQSVEQLTVDGHDPLKNTPTLADGTRRVIVELHTPSVIAQQVAAGETVEPTSRSAARARVAIQAEQAVVLAAAGLASADYAWQTLLNGLALRVSAEQQAALEQSPLVKAVYPDHTYKLQLDASLTLINRNPAWLTAGGPNGAGSGVKVAVIDSGIEPGHPLFSGSDFPMPSGYPKGYCATDDASFCNGKIIAARWYGNGNSVPGGAIAQEVASPLDRTGHGSHVAGIAVGNYGTAGIDATIGDGLTEKVSGVAPGAWLMVYKACWNGADCPGAGLIQAMEDAVLDGADVINNSWGGGPGSDPLTNAFRTAVENAVAAGVPVVFSAGNNGSDGASTITCPACVEQTIAVGAVTTNRVHGNRIEILGPGTVPDAFSEFVSVPGAESLQAFPLSNVGIRYALSVDSNNSDACQPFVGTPFAGDVALVHRGGCSFGTKVQNAAAAGAWVVLIINDVGGPAVRFSVGTATQIPALMLSQTDGLNLRDWVIGNPSATMTIHPLARLTNNSWDNIVGTNSSLGPNGDPSVLKPDVVAPGVTILSADTYAFGGTGYRFDTGSSMAAPHVTGAVAILKGLHPDWGPEQLKTAVTSTAVRDALIASDGFSPADPFARGSGRIDLGRMVEAGVTFDTPSFAEPTCVVSCRWTNTIHNELNETVTWNALPVTSGDMIITVSPSSVTLAPGESATFEMTVNISAMPVGQWVFGALKWIHDSPNPATEAYLPVVVYTVAGSETAAFTKTADLPDPFYRDDAFTWNIQIVNPDSADTRYWITDTLPSNVDYVNGTASSGLNYNAANRAFTADTGLLAPALSFSAEAGTGYVDLLALNPSLEPFACSGECDDDWFKVENLDFSYMGIQFDTLYISTNGFIALTPPPAGFPTNQPQAFPTATAPNHLIAPLWTDFDLDGTNASDGGGGALYGASASNGAVTWNVFEWRDVAHWADNNATARFQLWIERGTSNLWFAYGDLSNWSTLAAFPLSIGAEDGTGQIGRSYWYGSAGNPPVGTAPTTTQDIVLSSNGGFIYSFNALMTTGLETTNTATASNGTTYWNATSHVRMGEDIYLPLLER